MRSLIYKSCLYILLFIIFIFFIYCVFDNTLPHKNNKNIDPVIYSIDFLKNDKWLVSGGHDNLIKIWDINAGTLLYSLEGHKGKVKTVAASKDGSIILSSGFDGVIIIWEIISNQIKQKILPSLNTTINSIVISPDNQFFITGSWDYLIRLWPFGSNKEMVTIGSHEKEVKRLAISNDGLIVASSSLDGKVMLWNLENRQLTGLIQYPVVSPINAVAISPDKSLIATGDWNGTIILWSIPDIKILWSANVHTNKIKSISFSPDGQEFVSGGKDNNVFIFDISNNLPKTAIHDANAPVFTVKYSSDGNLIGTAGREGIIRLYTKIGDKNLNWKLQKEIHSK